MEKSDFQLLKEFINNIPLGEVFTPKIIRDNVRKSTSMSTYINYLNKYGFINKIDTGKYIRLFHLDEDVSLNFITNTIYGEPKYDRERIVNIYMRYNKLIKFVK